jgi:hypothetical protein
MTQSGHAEAPRYDLMTAIFYNGERISVRTIAEVSRARAQKENFFLQRLTARCEWDFPMQGSLKISRLDGGDIKAANYVRTMLGATLVCASIKHSARASLL